MPIYVFACDNYECSSHKEEAEYICKVNETKGCEACGFSMKKLIRAPKTRQVPHISWSTWSIGMGGND